MVANSAMITMTTRSSMRVIPRSFRLSISKVDIVDAENRHQHRKDHCPDNHTHHENDCGLKNSSQRLYGCPDVFFKRLGDLEQHAVQPACFFADLDQVYGQTGKHGSVAHWLRHAFTAFGAVGNLRNALRDEL